jgi:NADPH:quinone reductase-like Zn-dependent oxidoreductase
MSFEQAASVPIAGITALEALRDKGQIKPGQKVLINGASGGVGTFAVQIAKSYGAEVTGVCSARNEEMVRSIGADHVFDYKKENYTESGQKYDLIIDMIGNHSLSENRQVMTPEGIFVGVGGSKGNWIGPLMRPINSLLYSPFVDQQFLTLFAQMGQQDLQVLSNLLKSGELTPVIDRSYPLSEVPAAIEYSEQGHARGKIIINLE